MPKRSDQHMQSQAPATRLQDIADFCGLSLGTISLALRRDPRLRPETIERVIAAAETLGYDPMIHHAARRLAYKKQGKTVLSRVVAVFFHDRFLQSPYFVRLMEGIMHVVTREDFGLLTCFNSDDKPSLPPIVSRGDVDGAIVLGSLKDYAALVERLRGTLLFGSKPIVTMINSREGYSSVIATDRIGSREAAEHLLALGHRHILAFQMHDQIHFERTTGIREAYKARGLDDADYLHLIDWTYKDFEESVEYAVEKLLEDRRITAILANNDEQANVFHYALARNNLRVPEDISIIGHDDFGPILNSEGENILTTIRVPLFDIGMEAARICIKRASGEIKDDRQIILPTKFITRGSTAPPASVLTK